MERKESIKRSVYASKELQVQLCRLFNVTERTIRKALLEWSDKGICPNIRKAALEMGGYTQVVLPEVNTWFDHEGTMRQSYPNGVQLTIKKGTDIGISSRKGKEIGRYTVTFENIGSIQEQLYNMKF